MPAAYIIDRVVEASTTTGTGAFTLAGAVTGFQSFASAIGGGGGSCHYLIEAVDTNGVPTGEWETGIGTFDGSTGLARTYIFNSSGGSPVAFSVGAKRVYMAGVAKQLGFCGACATKTADLTGQNLTTAAAVAWNNHFSTIGIDTDGFHNTVTNNSRMTLPSTWPDNMVRLSGQIGLANATANEWAELSIKQNGTTTLVKATHSSAKTGPVYQINSPLISCVGGDYFELFVQIQSDTSVDIDHTQSWFQLEVLQ